jgi:transposase-like protein
MVLLSSPSPRDYEKILTGRGPESGKQVTERETIGRSRFREEQIIGILKEHQAGLSAQELCRKYGVSDATFYKWRSKYGGMDLSDARKPKALEDENTAAEEAAGRVDARCGDAQRDAEKKLLTPRGCQGARTAVLSVPVP